MAADAELQGGVVVVTTMETEFRAMRDHLHSLTEHWHKAGTYFVRVAHQRGHSGGPDRRRRAAAV